MFNLAPNSLRAFAEAIEEAVLCECGHDTDEHADFDYDAELGVAPRPCNRCDCKHYFEG